MFSNTVEYALRAIVYLAYESPDARTTAQISEATKIPKDYLAKILQGLAKKKIVSTQRGVGGGVSLAKTPEELHVMAFDPDDGRIVRVTIPFWLLRLKLGSSTIDFNGNRMDLEDLRLSVEDLENFGPTLIVDHTERGGDRVLVWSQ